MNTDEALGVVTRVLAQIAPEVDLATVAPNADLQEELDLDSMDFLNFVTGILEVSGIEVPERDYPALQSLEGCTRYLVEHSADPGEAASRST
ncbi:MAG: acyl carrier protein [Acidimicrobiia bacterium]